MDYSTPGFPVHHQLLELAQTHVHWVNDAIPPSHPLLSPSPPTFSFSQHQGIFSWVSSLHQVITNHKCCNGESAKAWWSRIPFSLHCMTWSKCTVSCSIQKEMLHINPHNIRGGLNLERGSIWGFPATGGHQGIPQILWVGRHRVTKVELTCLGSSSPCARGSPRCFTTAPYCSLVAESCLTLCDPMNCTAHQAPLSFTIPWSLLKLMSTESMMPSNHLILYHPLLLLSSIFPSIRVFSDQSALHSRWPKYWSFNISPSNEYSGLISFRTDWLDLCTTQGTLKSLLQHHNSKASILQCSVFFMVQLSHPYMTTRKTIALIIWTTAD